VFLGDANPGLDDFFTWESLGTFQGATAAILLVVNVFGYLIGPRFDRARKWVAIVLALGIEAALSYKAAGSGFEKWFVAFLNALLLFAAAMGINEGAGRGLGLAGDDLTKRSFFRSWIR
jgi:hypothetical protein